jgi:hypothetical protein
MTRELFSALTDAIKSVQVDGQQLVQHIDLWNQNVEFIDQEQAWPRPAVFIEFGQANYRLLSGPSITATAEVVVTLHIVTDWKGSTADGSDQQDAALEVLDFPWLIAQAVADIPDGQTFRRVMLLSDRPNHNHEQLVETLQQYSVAIQRTF